MPRKREAKVAQSSSRSDLTPTYPSASICMALLHGSSQASFHCLGDRRLVVLACA
jgi:hypothetical protein